MSNKLSNHKHYPYLRALSLLATFYVSYLFLHFVILELTTIDNVLVIIAIIWVGHILLNTASIMSTKNRTFGDLLVQLEYLPRHKTSELTKPVFARAMVSSTLFYLVICMNVLLGFPMLGLVLSATLALVILTYQFEHQGEKVSFVDWVSSTVVIKR